MTDAIHSSSGLDEGGRAGGPITSDAALPSFQAWPFGKLLPMAHDLIVADPPWPFDLYSNAGNHKSPARYYDLMRMEDIEALPVDRLARGDCLMLLWCCAPSLPQAVRVLGAWGFTYKSNIVWRKVTRNAKVRWGPGYRARTGHELILLGVMGNPRHKPFPSIFDGLAREHSRKPDELYALADAHARPLVPLDLFSRETRPNWTSWGLETGKFDKDAA